jgi:hypothetical protein
MTANWAVHERITVSAILPPTAVTDATPVLSTDFNVKTYPGARLAIVLTATETNAGNTGGVWTVTESATDGGSYTSCTLGGTLVATPASAGTNVQKVSVLANSSKPFVLVTYTGADADTEVNITATLVVIPTNI